MTDRWRATFVVPGGVEAETGGNVYDRAAIRSLARRGWEVAVDDTTDAVEGDVVVLDSLAMPAGPPATEAALVALVHQIPSEAAGRQPSVEEVAVLRAAASTVTVSAWLAGRVAGLGARPVVVVPPGRDRAWASEGSRADASTVLCVANAYPGKGLPEAVEAFARAAPDGIALRIAGDHRRDATEAARLDAAIRRTAAPVELLGIVPPTELSIAYGETLALLAPSRYEGWPIAVAEAMASGIPVVGFAVPGVAELVRDGVDGMLVPPGDVEALVRALAQVCGDARLRSRFGSSARDRALAWPTWGETAERFADVIERVARQASGAPKPP